MKAIRGAITCENNRESILQATNTLIKEIMLKNALSSTTMSAIVFSTTQDLDAVYPAVAVREQLNIKDVPMMCTMEMPVKNSLAHCIRVLVMTDLPSDSKVKHCYLEGAKVLRPDL